MFISDSSLSKRVAQVKRALEDKCLTGAENRDYANVLNPECDQSSFSPMWMPGVWDDYRKSSSLLKK